MRMVCSAHQRELVCGQILFARTAQLTPCVQCNDRALASGVHTLADKHPPTFLLFARMYSTTLSCGWAHIAFHHWTCTSSGSAHLPFGWLWLVSASFLTSWQVITFLYKNDTGCHWQRILVPIPVSVFPLCVLAGEERGPSRPVCAQWSLQLFVSWHCFLLQDRTLLYHFVSQSSLFTVYVSIN